MDISRNEQRVLHTLARGGRINAIKNENGRITGVECLSREGWLMTQCTLLLFKKLKHKRAIRSLHSGPYRITKHGLELVRGEFDNR